MSVLTVLAVFAALCAAYGMLLRRYGLRGLTCSRSFSRGAVFEGEEAEMIEVIGNDRLMLVPWLRVESRVSRNLQFTRRPPENDGDFVYHKSLFTLLPYQRITRKHRVRFLRRGAYNLGNASLTAGDLVGVVQCSREQQMDVPVLVYPRLLEENELPAPLSRLLGECLMERQLLRDPFLVRGIRPYLPGDPVRDMHWPATARTGEAQVRIHDFTAQTRLMVVLNAQLTEDQWDNLMPYEQDRIERMISIAATLCVRALHGGLPAGFAANMPLQGKDECTVLPPAAGAERTEALLSAFARLRILRKLGFNTFLEELGAYTDLDVIVLSCYDSPSLEARLESLRQRGNTVSLYVVEGGEEA